MAGPSWAYLPSVLIVEILSYLSNKDKLKATSVCKRWRSYLFQPSIWPKLTLNLRRNEQKKTTFLADVCGRFVRECVVKFDSHEPVEVSECYKLLSVLVENRNLQVLQLEPSSCHIEWPEHLTCNRFAKRLEDVIRTSHKLKHFSIGCSEELLEHSSFFLDILSRQHGNTLGALHLASVKEDSENYGIIDLDVQHFQRFSCLKHLSMDYDFLDNLFLDTFTNNTRTELQSLCIHVHGIDPEHEKVTNATWRRLVSRCQNLEVTVNLVHSYVGIANLLDILQANLPLTHFRQFFCSNINVAALSLMSAHYGSTLKSIHIVDGFHEDLPVVYDMNINEDPFVMLAWKCPLLESITLIGYEMSDNDLVAVARLRGKHLRNLNIPNSCIRWLPDGEDVEVVGAVGPEFSNKISTSLGREWHPLEDIDLPEAVFDDWADAEIAYNNILLKDQIYRK